MSTSSLGRHHVIIGGGIAGSQAAETLREREPNSRVSIITMSSLLFYSRYDLPLVFRGKSDWREFLIHPPAYYTDRKIQVRRNSRVANVDPQKRLITLAHKETVLYDTLLVASGGSAYLPEDLADYRPMMSSFATFEQAMLMARRLPEEGHVLILGGDMIGLDLAYTLVETGHRVTIMASEHMFWPHGINAAGRPALMEALRGKGIEVIEANAVGGGVGGIEEGAKGMPARRVSFKDGTELHCDMVLPFFGLVPAVEFMLGSGVDIERGILVSPELRTTDSNIYAAGDVCQIWSAEDKRYKFYFGGKNVEAMAKLAARNMTGATDVFTCIEDDTLRIGDNGRIVSTY